jgi:Family of unknown function (DUF5990)
MTTMVVEIWGSDLPGRRCGPTPDGGSYQNIHVGIARRADTIELVPGDAPSARWQIEVTVRGGDDGNFDYGGPFVHGRRGERHLGLRWGTLGDDGTFAVFRAANLRFSDVDASVVQQALRSGGRLVGSLGLTDAQGWPRCASVRPPDITWSAAAD